MNPFPSLSSYPTFWVRLLVLGGGMLGVGSIALHAMGWMPLSQACFWLVLPVLLLFLLLALRYPDLGRTMARGWLMGLLAVACYDLSRWPFIAWGWWGDFIPSIGAWLLEQPESHAGLGYLWRYAANGGGLGVAFFVSLLPLLPPTRHILGGTLFGVAVFSGLMATICLAPDGEILLFPLSPLTITGSLLGHLVYGAVLGLGAQRLRVKRFLPGPRMASSSANLDLS